MTVPSIPTQRAVYALLPPVPGITCIGLMAALKAAGHPHHSLQSVKRAIYDLRRGGHLATGPHHGGHKPVEYWRGDVPLREPEPPPPVPVADKRPHVYPVSVLQTRLPKTPTVTRPNLQPPLPTDEVFVAAWARGEGMEWRGWASLPVVNERRRERGRIEFARPGAQPPPPPAHPAVKPVVRDTDATDRVFQRLRSLARDSDVMPSLTAIANMCGLPNAHAVDSCLRMLQTRGAIIRWNGSRSEHRGQQSIFIVRDGRRLRTVDCPAGVDPVVRADGYEMTHPMVRP